MYLSNLFLLEIFILCIGKIEIEFRIENFAANRFPFAHLPQLLSLSLSLQLQSICGKSQLYLPECVCVCGDYLNVSNACGKLG